MSSNNAFSDFAFEGAAVEPSEKPTTKKRKRTYRQAKESRDGAVEILCFSCRRSQSNKIQPALEQFLKPPQAKTWPCWRCTFENKTALGICEICRAKRLPEPGSKSADDGPTLAGYSDASGPFCSRCRKDMNPNRNAGKAKSTKALPIIARLQGYKRLAAEHNLPFVLEDHEAIALMRQDCVICGAKASADGHGITRLRHWPDSLVKLKAKCSKPYMGPFCKENTTTACGVCNLMKGARSIQSCVEAARHIATYRGKHIKNGGEDFGLYPKRFRHNISKRSRSSYITKSSTHQKTHCKYLKLQGIMCPNRKTFSPCLCPRFDQRTIYSYSRKAVPLLW